MSDMVIGSLTDDRIRELSSDRAIATHKDFNLKKSTLTDDRESFTLHPEPKGIYDPRYFGSIYSKSCNCGRIKKVGMTCDMCGSMLLTEEMAFNRFARIDMGFYFCHRLKLQELVRYLKSNYIIGFEHDEDYPNLGNMFKINDKGVARLDLANALLVAKVDYDEEGKVLIFTNKITDPMDSGIDSLVRVLRRLNDTKYEDFVNRLIIVTPARMRQVIIRVVGTRKEVKSPESSIAYSALAYVADDLSHHLTVYYSKPNSSVEDIMRLVLKKAAANKVIIATEDKLTSLTASSKENIARQSYKIRQDGSGRSVISGDPNLLINEVGIPVQLAYEALKSDFIDHIRSELRVKKSDAILRYMEPDTQIKQMFREYAQTRKVLLNRSPTLHKYNILSFDLRLSDDNAIHIPLAVTGAFNADKHCSLYK